MIKIQGLDKLQSRINQIATTIRKASTLESFSKSPELPLIVGRCIQRTIDAQKFKPLKPKYKIARDKKFGKRPILRLTDALYKRALLPGFASITTSNSFRTIQIRITDLIGLYQQAIGRELLRPDQQLRNELFNLANKELAKALQAELRK